MARTVEWHVDDRGPTPWARAYVAGMRARRDKDAFSGAEHTLATARDRQRAGDAPPTRLTRLACRVRSEDRDGMTTWTVRPRRAEPVVRVLYLHGGGYVHPLTPDYWHLVRALARVPAEVVVPAYPLAPGATATEVLPRLRALLQDEEAGTSPPWVLAGDSAGGALALVLAQQLAGTTWAASGLLLLSPWLDPLLSSPEVEGLEATDPMLAESGLRAAARAWAGDLPLDDPRVAPLRGPLDDLPTCDVLVGDRDILRPAVDELAGSVRPVRPFRVWESTAMFHVWMTRRLPEATRTRRHLVHLLRGHARLASRA